MAIVCLPAGWADEDVDLADLSLAELMNVNLNVASMRGDTVLDTPSTVTVVDQDLIREYNLQSVAEALDLVAGFAVMRTYIKRDLPTSRGVLQDHYANKVLILINGIPTWNAVTGEGNLSRIDINDVARIEVLKGPASVLYGTNAYSGAVNIVLKDASKHSSELQLGLAEDYGFRAGGHFLFAKDDYRLTVAANTVRDEAGEFVFEDETGVNGSVEQYMRSNNFTLAAANTNHSFFVNAFTAEESFLGTTPRFALGAGHQHDLNGVLANYTYSRPLGDTVDFDLGLSYDRNERNFSRSFDDDTRANVLGERLNLFARGVITATESLNFEVGLDWDDRTSKEYRNYSVRADETLADNNMRDRSVSEYSAFAQANYQYESLRILVGSRFTDNELFGSNVSSRATVVYSLGEHNSIKGIFGQSYRAPSLFEVYFRTPTNTVWGNPELEPEKSDSFELAYLGTFGNLFVDALVYHAEYDNKIFRTRRYPDYVDDPSDSSTIYVNGGSFTADGAELGLRYRVPKDLSFFVHYGYVDGDDGDRIEGEDHYNFKYVPEHSIAAGLAKHFRSFMVSVVGHYQSSVGAPLDEIGGQSFFDLNAAYRQRLGQVDVRHTISVKNLGDDEVEIPEYVRRNLNDVRSGYGRRISYVLYLKF